MGDFQKKPVFEGLLFFSLFPIMVKGRGGQNLCHNSLSFCSLLPSQVGGLKEIGTYSLFSYLFFLDCVPKGRTVSWLLIIIRVFPCCKSAGDVLAGPGRQKQLKLCTVQQIKYNLVIKIFCLVSVQLITSPALLTWWNEDVASLTQL